MKIETCSANKLIGFLFPGRRGSGRQLFWVFLFGLAVVSCRPEAPPVGFAKSADTNEQTFIVRGVVREIDGKTAVIKHGEITNYMPAMTMPFTARNTNEIRFLKPGDAVSFRLNVKGDDSWIDQVRKANVSPMELPSRESVLPAARNSDPLEVQQPVPDYTFTNELGKRVSLAQFKGQAVALTFIFTRCPLPDFCPRLSGQFAAAAARLKGDPAAPTNWHMLSISFDPAFDTPGILKAYAQRYHYDPERWSFLTGDLAEIGALAGQAGMIYFPQTGGFDHKLRTLVIDARGRLQTNFFGNAWTSDQLVEELKRAAAVGP